MPGGGSGFGGFSLDFGVGGGLFSSLLLRLDFTRRRRRIGRDGIAVAAPSQESGETNAQQGGGAKWNLSYHELPLFVNREVPASLRDSAKEADIY
jgi:hypothetical protein